MAEGRTNAPSPAGSYINAKTVESHIATIFTKLGLQPAADDHRRVLAVLTWLDAPVRDGGAGPDPAR